VIDFRIHFFGPFRVASGAAAPGVDSAVDQRSLLPESSLKGVMRKAAADLGTPPSLIDEVFGAPRTGSPWAWGPVTFEEAPTISRRTRVKIDGQTGTVEDGALMIAHEVWASSARFDIRPLVHINEPTARQHVAVLVASARAVRSLGASRNRGLGWVGIEVLGGGDAVDAAAVLKALEGSQ
jgi:CRISPR/Cas system CSM-associated protein Csm3 (group 7 of RAMP superfamily)